MPEVIVPNDGWEGDAPGAVSVWFYSDGQQVAQDSLLAEVMVEKATVEIHAPAAGRLHIRISADGLVHKGDVLATIT